MSAESDFAGCLKLSADLAAANADLAAANADLAAALDTATRENAELKEKLAAASSTHAAAPQIAAIASPLVTPALVFFSPQTGGKYEVYILAILVLLQNCRIMMFLIVKNGESHAKVFIFSVNRCSRGILFTLLFFCKS